MIQTDKHILLTGATGFLGCYILRTLLRSGYTHITCTHRPTSKYTLIDDVKHKVTWVECDLTDELQIESIIEGIDLVIHAAAKVSLSNKNSKSIMQANLDSTRLLVDYSLDATVQKFVFVSSIASIGLGEENRMIDENTDWNDGDDNSTYGVSKQLAEREVMRASAEGLDVVIVNPSMIIGAGEWNSSTVSIVNMVYKGLPYYPAGSIGIVDVRDVADIIILAVEATINGERFIVSAENWTHRRLIEKLSEVYEKKPPTKQMSSLVAKLGMVAASISQLIKGDNSILSAQSIKMSQRTLEYDHTKSIEQFNFTYRSIDQSLQEIGDLFVQCKNEGTDWAILDI